MAYLTPVFVGGPYASDTQEGVERNIERAMQVGRALAAEGYAPIVVHKTGSFFYGSEGGENGDAPTDDSRARALAGSRTVAFMVGRVGGVFAAIPEKYGEGHVPFFSDGTTQDMAAYFDGCIASRIKPKLIVRDPP